MPRDHATILADLIGKLDVVYVDCAKCKQSGSYKVQSLIEERGRDCKVIDWLNDIIADCSKKRAANMNDQCGVRCPYLPRVLPSLPCV